MPEYGKLGLFYGGVVSKDAATSSLALTGFLMRTPSGMVGVGDGTPARRVHVSFNQQALDYSVSTIDDFNLPVYELRVPPTAGSAYLSFDPVVSEITVLAARDLGKPVLAKIVWPAAAASVNDLTIDLTERQISVVSEVIEPIQPSEYYSQGMDWGDSNFNRPLVSFGVMSRVLQGESRARLGDAFHFSTLTNNHIERGTDTVTFKRFEMSLRDLVGGKPVFRHIDTQRDQVLSFQPLADWSNTTIHVGMHPETGELVVGKGARPNVMLDSGLTAQAIPLAYSVVPAGATTLSAYPFIVVSDSTADNLQTGADLSIQQIAAPTGFVKPLNLRPHPSADRTVITDDNVLLLRGAAVRLPAQSIAMSDAPASGDRLDFLYLELKRELVPSVPLDGSLYVQVAGSGYAVIRPTIRRVDGVTLHDPDELLMTLTIPGLDPSARYRPSAEGDGSFFVLDSTSAGGTAWAIPLGYVSSYSQETYAYDKPAGGVGRPDGKSATRFHLDEIEDCSPVLRREISDAQAFGGVWDAILRGEPTMLERGGVANYPSPYSKHPLQADAISTNPVPGANMLTPPNGLRRQWSAMPRPYWISSSFEVKGNTALNTVYANKLVTYNIQTRELTILLPAGVTLYQQGGVGGVPQVTLVWSHNGENVTLSTPVSAAADGKSATATLSPSTADGFPAVDQIYLVAVAVRVMGVRDTYLKEAPHQIVGGRFNGQPAVVVDELAGTVDLPHALGIQRVSPISPKRAAADMLLISKVGDGTRTYRVPTLVDDRQLLYVSHVEVLDNAGAVVDVLALEVVRDLATEIEVQTYVNIPAGTPIRIVCGRGGRLVQVRRDVNGIQEFAYAQPLNTFSGGGRTNRSFTRAYSTLLGVGQMISDPQTEAFTSVVWVEGRQYPATITGIDGNLAEITIQITANQRAMATNPDNWVLDSDGLTYTLKQGVMIVFPVLMSAAPVEGDTFVLLTKSSALGFLPVRNISGLDIVHRGMVLSSSDSIANTADSGLSPLAERFPLSRGMLMAPDASPVVTSVRDPLLQIQQSGGRLPVEGAVFDISSTADINMGVFVDQPGTGFAAWCALVRPIRRYVFGTEVVSYRSRNLLMFAYVITDGALTVNNPARAFFARPLAGYVG